MKKIGWLVPLLLLMATPASAQVLCSELEANSCQLAGFPSCFICEQGNCVPDDGFCNDRNDCTVDDCIDQAGPVVGIINGCSNISLVLGGETDLPAECFICEPTENEIDIDNGICDRSAGEDCSNSPDCQSPGETCATPVDPANDCEPVGGLPACSDGDVCTTDLCIDLEIGGAVCQISEKNCSPVIADGCCPSGCVGPDVGIDCRSSGLNNCDPDCWPTQDCGDGLVQPSETCDDNTDTGVAGVNPDGTDVPNADCRNPGTANECTYCGDGIQDVGSEECDGDDDAACTAGCDTDCTCLSVGVDLEGSGCALNPIAAAFPGHFGWILMLLLSGSAFYIWKRKLN